MTPIPFNPSFRVFLGKRWRGEYASFGDLAKAGIAPYYKNGKLMWEATVRGYPDIKVSGKASNPLAARDIANRKFHREHAKRPPPRMMWGCLTVDGTTEGVISEGVDQ